MADELPAELEEQCSECHKSLAGVERLLKPLMAMNRTQIEEKVFTSNWRALHSFPLCFWLYFRYLHSWGRWMLHLKSFCWPMLWTLSIGVCSVPIYHSVGGRNLVPLVTWFIGHTLSLSLALDRYFFSSPTHPLHFFLWRKIQMACKTLCLFHSEIEDKLRFPIALMHF